MRVRAIAAAATAIALSAFSPAASALAAHDVTAPVISTNVYASFVVGSVISAADYRVSNDLEAQTTKVDQRMTYTINDDSGRI